MSPAVNEASNSSPPPGKSRTTSASPVTNTKAPFAASPCLKITAFGAYSRACTMRPTLAKADSLQPAQSVQSFKSLSIGMASARMALNLGVARVTAHRTIVHRVLHACQL